jgi:hypothetical protein
MKTSTRLWFFVLFAIAVAGFVMSIIALTNSNTTQVFAQNGFAAAIGPNLTLGVTPANGLISASDGALVHATNTDVTSKLLSGFVSGSGPLLSSDSLLQAIEKLDGNITGSSASVVAANGFGAAMGPALTLSVTPSNGLLSASGGGLVHATDGDVTSKLLSGLITSPGAVSNTDSILAAFGKLYGNQTTPSQAKVVLSVAAGGGSTTFNATGPQFTTVTNLSLDLNSTDFTLSGQVLTYTGATTKPFCVVTLLSVLNPPQNVEFFFWNAVNAIPVSPPHNNVLFELNGTGVQSTTLTITDRLILATNDTVQLASDVVSGSFPVTLNHPIVSYYIFQV